MSNCNTPAQLPCGPGPYQSAICYTIPPALDVLPGIKEITLNADCSLATSTILDTGGAPVVGAAEAVCSGPCGDCGGTVVTAQPITVQDEGAVVASGVTCLNFVGGAITATLVGACVNVTVTAGAIAFPVLAPNGSCVAPSYSFTASPTSGMWFDPTLGIAGAVVISDNNCANRINVGASIEALTAVAALFLADNGQFTLTGFGGAEIDSNTGGAILITAGAGASATLQTTAGLIALHDLGEIELPNGVGAAGEVVTSAGLGLPATWQPISPSFPLLAPDGSCVAPSYSFASSPTSGMWFDPALGAAGAVVISDNNCTNRIEVGASINVFAGPVATGGQIVIRAGEATGTGAGSVDIQGGFETVNGGSGGQVICTGSSPFGTGGDVVINGGPPGGIGSRGLVNVTGRFFLVRTGALGLVSRLQIESDGSWHVGPGLPGVAGQVLTSQGPGLPPVWA